MNQAGQKQNLILMGLKHSGKSSLGRRLALSRGSEFFDLDDLLLIPARKEWERLDISEPLSCRSLYRYSPDLFREMEVRGAELAVEEMTRRGIVLALGGGTMENRPAMELLAPGGTIIYLEEDPAVLYERIIRGGIPPFFDRKDPWQSFLELYQKRSKLCVQWADLRINLQGAGLSEAWKLIDNRLN